MWTIKPADLLIQSIHRLRSDDEIAIHHAKPLKTACGDFKNKQQHILIGHFFKDCTIGRKVYSIVYIVTLSGNFHDSHKKNVVKSGASF